jgi:hypothetical protein
MTGAGHVSCGFTRMPDPAEHARRQAAYAASRAEWQRTVVAGIERRLAEALAAQQAPPPEPVPDA